MYHPARIAEKLDQICADPAFGTLFPDGFPEYPLADRRALTQQIAATRRVDEDGKVEIVRALDAEEERFVVASRLRVAVDAPYYLETFVWIDEEGHGLRPLYPLWDSQTFLLARLAALEQRHHQQQAPDGLLINALKARQVGFSTLGSALVSHRIFTQPYIRAISGSDVEEQATYLLKMVERIYAHLPWFLQPQKVAYRTGRYLQLGNHSAVKTAWGKTTRGALQDEGGKKGNIERGRTNSVVHISELATWDHPEQLDTSLMPGVPRSPDSLVLFESTAELAGDWWHKHWQACEDGTSPRDWSNIFMPWCVRADRKLPAPPDWVPSDHTRAVQTSIEREMPRYTGSAIRLSRDQLYWYESERAFMIKKGRMLDFYKEYPSNPQECFQYTGRSVFSFEDLERIDAAARPLIDVWRVEPAREIAELRRLAPDADLRAAALQTDRRPPAPAKIRPIGGADLNFQVPPGYGFRRLAPAELDALPSLRHSVLAIYEYPRARGRRRYIMGVDVGDGIGQDYSTITVVREPTLDEIMEDVAQFVSNTVKPSALAYICDAIGRLYCDEDGIEALAAIELNNHGATVQDLLQLHLGYTHFYVWEVVDAAQAEGRFTKRIGWTTTARTRPILLEKFNDMVTTVDPISGLADFRINAAITRAEMRFFVTEGTLGEAEHAKGQHDDAIFGSAIAGFVAHRMAGGEAEPIAERRRRRDTLKAQQALLGDRAVRRDFRNSDATAAQQNANDSGDDDDGTDLLYFA